MRCNVAILRLTNVDTKTNSPVIQCQLVNKNVFIAKNFNPNLSHPVFDQNYQDHKDCQQTTKDYYSIQPKTELDKNL